MRRLGRLFTAIVAGTLLLAGRSLAQPYVPTDSLFVTSREAGNWLGINMLGNPSLRFTSVQDYSSGVTLDHATLELSLAATLQWALQVRATGDLQNGAQSIPISILSIQPLNIGSNASTVTLSTASQTIATGQLLRLQLISPTFRYRAQGGKALLNKPGGAYSTTLIFTYTAL